MRIAKGEPMWDLKTTGGTTLYLCLEDTLRRVQNRLLCITDEVPPNAFFATSAGTLSDGLCEQMLVALGRDDLHKSYLGYTYCDDLEALGYIKMRGSGKDKKIFIIKDIDF